MTFPTWKRQREYRMDFLNFPIVNSIRQIANQCLNDAVNPKQLARFGFLGNCLLSEIAKGKTRTAKLIPRMG